MIITSRGDIETQEGHQVGIWRQAWFGPGNPDNQNPKLGYMRKRLGHCEKHGFTTFRKKVTTGAKGTYLVCVKCELEDTQMRRTNYIEKATKLGWNKQIWKCARCNQLFKYKELIDEMCKPCRNEVEEIQRNEERREKRKTDKKELLKYQDLMKECKTGVCDILKIHHEALKDDPERFPTEQLIELTCGTEGKEYYLEKRKERIKDTNDYNRRTKETA
jgi:hypothetical protein